MRKKVIIFLFVLLLLPIKVNAKTVADFEAEVDKYTKELQEKQAQVAKNDAEVKKVEQNIASIEKQITDTENEINRLTVEIDNNNKEIQKKLEQSKAIIAYYQIENGNNEYLEYAFGAETITDMIYRLSITEQLTDYNDRIMKELKELIVKNEQAKKDQAAKKENLKTLRTNLQSEKAKIEADTKGIVESMPSTQAMIKAAQDNLKYYKNLGCGKTEDISACQFRIIQSRSASSLPSVGAFQRPVEYGYVTQGYGGGHNGIDVSSSNKTIAIHPIAEGEVVARYKDNCTSGYWCSRLGHACNGNANIIVVRHNYNGRFIYSQYTHMSDFGQYGVGSFVTKDSIIGYMGTTGCSTGNHLHLEMATCHWKAQGGCTYATYTRSFVSPNNYVRFPSNWSNY